MGQRSLEMVTAIGCRMRYTTRALNVSRTQLIRSADAWISLKTIRCVIGR